MANLDEVILEGGALFSKYRRLDQRATASTNTRANQLAEIENHQRQIRILTERNALERQRANRLAREMRETLREMQRNGQVIILHDVDIDVLNRLYDEEGYFPRIFCPVPALRQALREGGYDPYGYP